MSDHKEKYISLTMRTGDALHLVLKAVAEGKKNIYFSAFKHTKRSETSPDYSSESCAAWVREFTPKKRQKNLEGTGSKNDL